MSLEHVPSEVLARELLDRIDNGMVITLTRDISGSTSEPVIYVKGDKYLLSGLALEVANTIVNTPVGEED